MATDEQTTNLSDLQGLLDLAEEVSGNIQILQDKLRFLWMQMMIRLMPLGMLSVFAWYIMAESNVFYFYVVAFLFALASLVQICVFIPTRKKILTDLRIESAIISRLLDMTHHLKERLSSEAIGPVPEALIEMRLRRISFSPAKGIRELKTKNSEARADWVASPASKLS